MPSRGAFGAAKAEKSKARDRRLIIVCCASLASRASLRCIIRRCPCCRDGDKSLANISCNCHIRVVAATRRRSLTRCPRPLFIYVAEIATAARSAFVECLTCLNSLRRSDCRVGSEGQCRKCARLWYGPVAGVFLSCIVPLSNGQDADLMGRKHLTQFHKSLRANVQ